ncbi:MAG: response regulator receiver protein [Bacteroidetes bacterium]|nr:response regulator receiver protein [Bacteroidota bacterium]
MRILIAEDNAATREIIKTIISPCTKEVIEAENGQEAVEAYARHRPDWVLMDFELPELDGIAATEFIRSMDPTARIVMVTAFRDRQVEERAIAAGVLAYVVKDNLMDLPALLVRASQSTNTIRGGFL